MSKRVETSPGRYENERQRGNRIGYSNKNWYIWTKCKLCDTSRWLAESKLMSGAASPVCPSCSHRNRYQTIRIERKKELDDVRSIPKNEYDYAKIGVAIVDKVYEMKQELDMAYKENERLQNENNELKTLIDTLRRADEGKKLVADHGMQEKMRTILDN